MCRAVAPAPQCNCGKTNATREHQLHCYRRSLITECNRLTEIERQLDYRLRVTLESDTWLRVTAGLQIQIQSGDNPKAEIVFHPHHLLQARIIYEIWPIGRDELKFWLEFGPNPLKPDGIVIHTNFAEIFSQTDERGRSFEGCQELGVQFAVVHRTKLIFLQSVKLLIKSGLRNRFR